MGLGCVTEKLRAYAAAEAARFQPEGLTNGARGVVAEPLHRRPDARRREVADQAHVLRPVPAAAGIGVVREAAEPPRIVGIGDLVVPDEVPAVDRDQVLDRQVRRELGGRAVHRVRQPAADVDPCLVLDPDAAVVDVAVSGMPGLVLLPHHLRDVPVARADDVLGGRVRARVAEPLERPRVRALGRVDHDHVDRVGQRPVRARVVRRARRQPVRLRVVGERRPRGSGARRETRKRRRRPRGRLGASLRGTQKSRILQAKTR